LLSNANAVCWKYHALLKKIEMKASNGDFCENHMSAEFGVWVIGRFVFLQTPE